jgi:protoheme IX farnesyltransferase
VAGTLLAGATIVDAAVSSGSFRNGFPTDGLSGADRKGIVTAIDPRANAAADPPQVRESGSTPLRTVGAYVALTKPRIIELLLVTTVPTMILAADGLPDWRLVVATLFGGTLAAGGANAFNSYLDRDIDRLMHRTRHRPLARGAVQPGAALVFASVLSVVSVGWLAVVVNAVSAALAAFAIAFYVVGYTMLLKRRTPQNIVWGGAAGCMPVLIGWSAVTGSLALPAWLLFAVIFLWTPPHYWPLSMRFRSDYAAAGVPMLPVVADRRTVARSIVRYSWAMVAVSLVLWWAADLGWVYGAAAVVLGAAFLAEAHALQRRAARALDDDELRPMRLFHGSISYLALLFAAVAIDPLLPY